MIDVGGMHLVLIFLCILWSTRVTDQTKDAVNYSCIESNITVKFTDSFQSYSARDYSTNCSLLQCSFSTNNSQNYRLSTTRCFDYLSVNNTRYCAPGILFLLYTDACVFTNILDEILLHNWWSLFHKYESTDANYRQIFSFTYLLGFIDQSLNINYDLPVSIAYNKSTANVNQMIHSVFFEMHDLFQQKLSAKISNSTLRYVSDWY